MNNYQTGGFKKRGEGFGGRSKVGGHRGGGKRPAGKGDVRSRTTTRPADLHKAQCATCHKDCMLPFRPNTDKPVYCSDCFGKKQGVSDRVSGGRDAGKAPRSERALPSNHDLNAIKLQLKTIEDRLNRILDIINPPVPAKKSTTK